MKEGDKLIEIQLKERIAHQIQYLFLKVDQLLLISEIVNNPAIRQYY